MKAANVEFATQLRSRAISQLHDLELADHIGGGLPRVDQIALDRLADVARRIGGVVRQILDRLVTAPALVVEAGIDHQPRRAPQLHPQPTEVGIGIGVEAHVLPQLLGIKAPALAVGGHPAEAAERRHIAQLGLD